ncbi:MAG: hypothetical protein JW759_06035 [Candidatus Coatesbacteria bacterium]|nr:hypothetical protein [Candidatus Coatesbacteria bacterium]
METSRIMALLLAASGGEICGKTMIQKEMYFLSMVLGEDLDFRAYYYGPYSEEVRWGQDELIGIGFVNMRREALGMEPKGGFEVTRYDFELTESGKELAQWLRKKHPEQSKKITEFVEKLQSIGNLNYLGLSMAAKVHYVLGKNGRLTQDEIRENARALGWAISEQDIEGAVQVLEKLGFVEAD